MVSATMHFAVHLRAINLRNIVRSAESIGVTKKVMSHPEFFWNLKCSYCLFKGGSAEGSCPLSGIGMSPKYLFFLLRRLRRRKKREEWGTAPYPRQGAQPLVTPAKRCLTGFSKIRDDS